MSKFKDIDATIKSVIQAYNLFGSNSRQFLELYRENHKILSQHKNDVLRKNYAKPVTLNGRLARRNDGHDNNLNLITPAYINGVLVEHIHVYDEVLEDAVIKEDNTFEVSNLKVYRFSRNRGNNRYHNIANMSLKPRGAVKWVDRNEL